VPLFFIKEPASAQEHVSTGRGRISACKKKGIAVPERGEYPLMTEGAWGTEKKEKRFFQKPTGGGNYKGKKVRFTLGGNRKNVFIFSLRGGIEKTNPKKPPPQHKKKPKTLTRNAKRDFYHPIGGQGGEGTYRHAQGKFLPKRGGERFKQAFGHQVWGDSSHVQRRKGTGRGTNKIRGEDPL